MKRLHEMVRRAALVTTVLGVALVAATATPPSRAAADGAFTYRGTVTRIVDGDTLDVRLASGKRERVRLVGIDSPEGGACYARAASERARALALSKRVVLKGDASQETRDRYGRLLAYVWLPGGKDLGYHLLAGGFAKVYIFRAPFQRLTAYRNAEAAARRGGVGQWKVCGSTTLQPLVPSPAEPPPSTGCHPSYSPCLPIVGDLDCADVRVMGVAPVRVLGSDPYRLDGDSDGLGCE